MKSSIAPPANAGDARYPLSAACTCRRTGGKKRRLAQLPALPHAAPENHPPRRQRQHKVCHRPARVLRFVRPRGMIRRQTLGRHARPLPHRLARAQPLPAPPVKRARSRKVIALGARQRDVPDLRMDRARAATRPPDHHARADTRADRDVQHVVEPRRSAPTVLANRRAIRVRVEPDGYRRRTRGETAPRRPCSATRASAST